VLPCPGCLASGSLDFEPKQLNDVLLLKNAHWWASVALRRRAPELAAWQPLDRTQQIPEIKGPPETGGAWRPIRSRKRGSRVIAHHNYTTYRGLRSRTKASRR
jgi:hypothetical protein